MTTVDTGQARGDDVRTLVMSRDEAQFLHDLVIFWNVSVAIQEKATGEPRNDLAVLLAILARQNP